ncbi:3-deoxy-D-manno-octulosonic acid transferase [Desulfosarcina cetonica]|uniref:3-deoxy-D-manno-octulosonic acid transferase n=1 Tax=Desulfosarcina cetonica TaxID=90730 RepID=UPI00248AF9FA|nr:glycosyltransferase N-terminal domain-containing protein [Desulfosarcina cetonica]
MNFFHFAYTALASGLYLAALPPIYSYVRKNPQRKAILYQRLGYPTVDRRRCPMGRPRIWMHAVSVGEVKAADAIVRALDARGQRVSIVLTTTTETGQQYALNTLGQRVMARFAPLDLWGATGRFLQLYRPDLFVCMETEIWPNWILRAHRAGIPTIFLNGRISARSIRSYLVIRHLLRPVLEKVAAFSMISEPDAQRIMALGAPKKRVVVNGNVKTDARWADLDETVVASLKGQFSLAATTPVFVAGSVRGAEIEALLEVYQKLAKRIDGLVFILAPRHIEKVSRITSIAQTRGISWQRRSEMDRSGGCRKHSFIILDTIGELRHVYGMASVVFCGASWCRWGDRISLSPPCGPNRFFTAHSWTILPMPGRCSSNTAVGSVSMIRTSSLIAPDTYWNTRTPHIELAFKPSRRSWRPGERRTAMPV